MIHLLPVYENLASTLQLCKMHTITIYAKIGVGGS